MCFKISFSNPPLRDLLAGKFTGISNYIDIINNPDYAKTVLLALGKSFAQVPVIVIFAIFVAVLLKQNFPGRIYYRIIFFIPVILSGVIMNYLFSDNVGTMSIFSELTGTNQSYNLFTAILGFKFMTQIGTLMWKSSVEILIFLAALQSVPDILYEVAEIDGATSWESFWHVTLPYISPFVILNFIYAAVDALVDPSNPVMTILTKMLQGAQGATIAVPGLAAALALLYMVVALAVILLFILLFRRWLH
jgi:ABC-type sugar transport system permease subunit